MIHASSVLAEITQGRRVWRRGACGLSAQLVDYPPSYEMARHAHRSASVSIVLAGSFEEEVDGRAYCIGPLCVVMKPAGALHATRSGAAGTRTLVVEVDAAMEQTFRGRYGLLDDCRWFDGHSQVAPCVLSLCAGLWLGAFMNDAALHGWLTQLARAVAAAPAPTGQDIGRHVGQALDMMRREQALSTATLARRLGLHPVYLARLFRERLGHSPGRIRQGFRLEAAVDRIVRSAQPLASIAVRSGFSDQSHMSRHVKWQLGVSAAALRRLGSAP